MNILNYSEEGFPHGICPFMSGQVVPLSNPQGIQTPNAIQAGPLFVPCTGEKCACFDIAYNRCVFISISHIRAEIQALHVTLVEIRKEVAEISIQLYDIAQGLLPLKPPENSPSPIMRIADSVEALAKITQQRERKKGNGPKD